MKRRFWMALPSYFLLAAAPPPDLDVREIRVEIREAEQRAGRKVDELERRVETIVSVATMIAIPLGLTVVGLIPAYLRLLRYTNKRVEERLDALIESRPRALLALIDERDGDHRRRRETPILVLADRLETEGLLRQSGFATVTTRSPATDRAAARIDRNSVVVLDLDGGCSEEVASGLISIHREEFFLVYTGGRSDLRGENVTFANSPVTLFSRLKELVDYKDALDREAGRTPVPPRQVQQENADANR